MSYLSRRSFIAGAAATLTSAFSIARPPSERKAFCYAGSFSAGKGPDGVTGNGKGIYLFEADLVTGALHPQDVTEDDANPWWLAFHPSKQCLYAANEITSPSNRTSGSINAYSVNSATGRLILLNSMSSHGARPAQISVHPSGKYLFSANFGSSNIAVFPLQASGALQDPIQIEEDHGTPGPKSASSRPKGSFADSGHDKPHPHMLLADASGRFVLQTDLGTDEIKTWTFDVTTGKLTLAGAPAAQFPPGDGPRHFAFHPTGKWVYSLQEEGCTVVVFDYDAGTGRLDNKQTISTVPAGFAGSDFTSEIIVSPDGKYVYAANRLYDSIVIFRIGADGRLTAAGEQWAHGDFPRHLTTDPTHTFLYCCNQRSDAITCFKVNRASGDLVFTGQFTPVGTPAILLFS